MRMMVRLVHDVIFESACSVGGDAVRNNVGSNVETENEQSELELFLNDL
jgi:hypothetical protein